MKMDCDKKAKLSVGVLESAESSEVASVGAHQPREQQ